MKTRRPAPKLNWIHNLPKPPPEPPVVHELTYWVAVRLDDSRAYSIRARTQKGCADARRAEGREKYAPPQKVTIHYSDAFDLVRQVLGEGGVEPWGAAG